MFDVEWLIGVNQEHNVTIERDISRAERKRELDAAVAGRHVKPPTEKKQPKKKGKGTPDKKSDDKDDKDKLKEKGDKTDKTQSGKVLPDTFSEATKEKFAKALSIHGKEAGTGKLPCGFHCDGGKCKPVGKNTCRFWHPK